MKSNEFIIEQLHKRFTSNMHRHDNVTWEAVLKELKKDLNILNSIIKMEEMGGEPDVFMDGKRMLYVEFSKETPEGHRNGCYDEEALIGRKKFPPQFSAWGQAKEMGLSIVDEDLYKAIQKIEPLDLKTSSWLDTPTELRKLGGALFGDRRYNRVFTYHNGADSYYGVRGYRAYIELTK